MNPKHWTYSRLTDFEKCPRLYAARYCSIYPEFKPSESPALKRGSQIHALMEHACKTGQKLPGALARYNKLVSELRSSWAYQEVEIPLGFDKRWRTVGWDFKSMWLRAKMDFAGINKNWTLGCVKDWKTGRMYGSNADQVRLYAGMMFERFSDMEHVEVELVYLDQKTGITEEILREQWVEKRKEFEDRAGTMLAARKFPANPSSYCGVCSYSASKGGPCAEGSDAGSGLQTSSKVIRVVAAQAASLDSRFTRPAADEGEAAAAGVRGAEAPKRKARKS